MLWPAIHIQARLLQHSYVVCFSIMEVHQFRLIWILKISLNIDTQWFLLKRIQPRQTRSISFLTIILTFMFWFNFHDLLYGFCRNRSLCRIYVKLQETRKSSDAVISTKLYEIISSECHKVHTVRYVWICRVFSEGKLINGELEMK